jgi:hypothetical protein
MGFRGYFLLVVKIAELNLPVAAVPVAFWTPTVAEAPFRRAVGPSMDW